MSVNTTKQNNKNAYKHKETRAIDKAKSKVDTELNGSPLPPPPSTWGKFFDKLVMDKLAHTNCSGVEKTSLLLIYEPLGTEIIAIGGLQYFRRTGASLNNTTSEPPVIHSNQANTTVTRRVNSDRTVSLESLDSRPEVQRRLIGWSGNDGIGMNPPGTIRGN